MIKPTSEKGYCYRFDTNENFEQYCYENELVHIKHKHDLWGIVVNNKNKEVGVTYFPSLSVEEQLKSSKGIIYCLTSNSRHQRLTKPIECYVNFGHIGPTYWIKDMIRDSVGFTKEQLTKIIDDVTLSISIRQTALYILGTKWTKEALTEVCNYLKTYPELNKDIDCLLNNFGVVDGAEDHIRNLKVAGVITEEKCNRICSCMKHIREKEILIPTRDIGVSQYAG